MAKKKSTAKSTTPGKKKTKATNGQQQSPESTGTTQSPETTESTGQAWEKGKSVKCAPDESEVVE